MLQSVSTGHLPKPLAQVSLSNVRAHQEGRGPAAEDCSLRKGAQVFKVTVGNPQLVQIQSESKWDESGVSILNLVITSNFNQRGYTTILVTIPEASLICPITCFAIIVQCSCPAGKMIVYETPIFIKKEDWLHYNEKNEAHENAILKNLPVNYRPPSIFGINLPVSENFYNADPSKPKFRNFYELSKKTGLYKQCEMKKSRKECGCTEAMKLSSFIQYSDCREKVYRVTYPVNDFLLKLYLKKSNQDLQQLSAPYFVLISELNNRTNWVATSTKINPSFDKLRKYFVMSTAMHNPDGLSISLFGSELYHFRITVISGVSFCNLVEEFQIYVDDPPMAYPFHYLVSMITAIGLGTFIMFYFTLQHYWSKFNIKTPCWKFKVHPSPGSKLFKFNK
ncbi:cation channel sperm-associated auxiliary subunit beta-like isoform X1 [Scyliorhinus torazame]